MISLSGINDEFYLRFLDKDVEKEGLEFKFVIEFLNVKKIDDDKYKIKVFKNIVENWIINVFSNDIK